MGRSTAICDSDAISKFNLTNSFYFLVGCTSIYIGLISYAGDLICLFGFQSTFALEYHSRICYVLF